jgi:hypothetical protein
LKEQSELYKQIWSILEIAGMNIDPQ